MAAIEAQIETTVFSANLDKFLQNLLLVGAQVQFIIITI